MFENCVKFAVIDGKRVKKSFICILEGLSLLAPCKVIQDGLYATCTSHIMHLIPPPPNSAKLLFFHFSWVLQPAQEKLKTMLIQNFGGQIRCTMGEVQVRMFWNPRCGFRIPGIGYRILSVGETWILNFED